ncbi:MAG: reductase [Candidatus Peribacteria bacterium]|nr:reductase [Candidatus Peribacteria bacterium]
MASPISRIIDTDGITFDDVLLLPGYTDFFRTDVDLAVSLHPTITLKIPVLSSPMDTVTEAGMAILMASSGGLGILHRSLTVKDQAEMVRAVKAHAVEDAALSAVDAKGRLLVGAAVGAGPDLDERIDALEAAEVDLLVVDSGHGHAKYIMEAVKLIKQKHPNMVVMAGNIATAEGAKALCDNGADILRVGMGPGSICTTRIVTGMGVPQITAIMEAAKGANKGVSLIADGGIRQMGDMAKALAAGAHAIMLGSMLAGLEESPGELIDIDGQMFKRYRGMGSVGAMKKGGAARYGQNAASQEHTLIAEGVEGMVPFKGPGGEFLYQIKGSIQSAFYYIGARTIDEFHDKARFIKITPASMKESHPHTLSSITDSGRNYVKG